MKLWHQIIRSIAAIFIASRAAAEITRRLDTTYP